MSLYSLARFRTGDYVLHLLTLFFRLFLSCFSNSHLFKRGYSICYLLILLLHFHQRPLLSINLTVQLELLGVLEVGKELSLLVLKDADKTHGLEGEVCLESIRNCIHELLELAELGD